MEAAKQLHNSVLLDEAIAELRIKEDGLYYDATFGRGGHSKQILTRLTSGKLIAADRDIAAIEFGKKEFANEIENSKLILKHANISQIKNVVTGINDDGQAQQALLDGLLFDLGVSSPQLDEAKRGFSFLRDAPLDMRMDQSQKTRAKGWMELSTEAEIANVLRDFGEERFAKKIAKLIKEALKQDKLNTTLDLANLISDNVKASGKKHPATRTFQAIRIAVNQELSELEIGLQQGFELLKSKGVFVVISFHSLEDRIVKRFVNKLLGKDKQIFRNISAIPMETIMQAEKIRAPKIKVLKMKMKPSMNEIETNPRSRAQ